MASQERAEQYRKTLRQALHVWLDQFPEDYMEPPNFPCLSHLETFCRKVMPGSELDAKVQRKGKIIRKDSSTKDSPLIKQLMDSSRPSPSRYTGSRSQSLPSYSYPPYSDILEIPTKHFAQQITAMDNVSATCNCLNGELILNYLKRLMRFGFKEKIKANHSLSCSISKPKR